MGAMTMTWAMDHLAAKSGWFRERIGQDSPQRATVLHAQRILTLTQQALTSDTLRSAEMVGVGGQIAS